MKYGFLCAWALACLAAPAAATTLSISAAPASVKVGDTFVLDVVVTDANDLYGFQFDIFFAAPVLQAREVVEGGFLAGGGGAATSFFPGFIDDTAGTVSFAANTLLGPGLGASGGGVLARLSLQAIAPGQGSLLLGNVVLLDSTLSELAAPMLFGGSVNVTAVPEPASAALFGCGLAMLATAGRRRR
jgi:hypothetical protein